MAEKVLVSVYVIGFGLSYRYFLGAADRAAHWLAPAALLFVFNFCFMKGFYNYCLSLILFWVVLGYCIGRRHCFRRRDAAIVGMLLRLVFSRTWLGGCWLPQVQSGFSCRPFGKHPVVSAGSLVPFYSCFC